MVTIVRLLENNLRQMYYIPRMEKVSFSVEGKSISREELFPSLCFMLYGFGVGEDVSEMEFRVKK